MSSASLIGCASGLRFYRIVVRNLYQADGPFFEFTRYRAGFTWARASTTAPSRTSIEPSSSIRTVLNFSICAVPTENLIEGSLGRAIPDQFDEFPVFSLLNRECRPEKGSLETASTAIKSLSPFLLRPEFEFSAHSATACGSCGRRFAIGTERNVRLSYPRFRAHFFRREILRGGLVARIAGWKRLFNPARDELRSCR